MEHTHFPFYHFSSETTCPMKSDRFDSASGTNKRMLSRMIRSELWIDCFFIKRDFRGLEHIYLSNNPVFSQTEIDLTVLEGTLQSVDTIAANPVISIDIDQSKLSPTLRQINEERRLPLSIRESSIIYQFSRTLIFRRLLSGYPHTLERIIQEAKLGFFNYEF